MQSKKYIFGFFLILIKNPGFLAVLEESVLLKIQFSKKRNLIKFLEFKGKQPYAEYILQKAHFLKKRRRKGPRFDSRW